VRNFANFSIADMHNFSPSQFQGRNMVANRAVTTATRRAPGRGQTMAEHIMGGTQLGRPAPALQKPDEQKTTKLCRLTVAM